MGIYSCNFINDYQKIDSVNIYLDRMNKRIKIKEYDILSDHTLERIIEFATKHQAGKIICSCKIEDMEVLAAAGFIFEGKIDGFFKGENAFFMSCFIDSERKRGTGYEEKNELITKCLKVKGTYREEECGCPYYIRTAGENDIKQMVRLFSEVFETYPTPVFDEDYLLETIRNGKILYKVALHEGRIVGMASADMDRENLNAEITDCAVYPEFRGKGILANIIHLLEKDMKEMGFMTLYSLSRAVNPGVNFVLSKHDYKFKGRLVKNCNICGTFEDMNIWVKSLIKA